MREFVGVKSSLLFHENLNNFLKREALIFNRIAVPMADMRGILKDPANEFESLLEAGIAFIPPHPTNEDLYTVEEYRNSMSQMSKLADELTQSAKEYESLDNCQVAPIRAEIAELERAFQGIRKAFLAVDYYSRAVSVQLRVIDGLDAIPILDSRMNTVDVSNVNRNEVVNIVLNNLPVPSDSVSWEQIIDYRSDPDSHSKFLALRHWMSEVARAELAPAEVEEKLEYLIDQYQKHMKLHRMKTNSGTIETVVTTGAEMLGDLLSFKWGKAAQALFSLKKREVALLEGELTAPGNEVAYIVKAREIFS